jgi:Anti-sigma-K factor rskA/Putative zinc-finger
LSGAQHISEDDLALYSMQALTPEENAVVKAHLDTCATCRSALADALADVSLVGMSTPQQALPEGARQRFLGAVQKKRAAPKPARVTASTPPHKHTSALGWFEWLVTAAALAVACYLGYHSFELQRQLDASRGEMAQLSAQAAHAQELQGLMDALSSPEAMRVTLTETKRPSQPFGHVTYLQSKGALIFVASGLRPMPHNKTYELWLMPANGKAPMPAGLFQPDAAGSASVVLPPLPEGIEAKSFDVTMEDAGGSATPTLPIVMAGQ